MLRIITGEAKGKKLESLEGNATRPTSDRIKEAIFSSIQFMLEGRRVLDLFAGSGQMALEALSRGADSAFFVDSSREAIEIVKRNISALGYEKRCRHLVSDYRNYIRKAAGKDQFDLVFIDPPYSMECALDAARGLCEAKMVRDGGIIVLECGTEPISEDMLSGFEIIKLTHYGKKTAVAILLYRSDK